MQWSWSYGCWIYNYLGNHCLSPLKLWVRISLSRGILDTTLYDEICLWLGAGRWFSVGTPVSSTINLTALSFQKIIVFDWIGNLIFIYISKNIVIVFRSKIIVTIMHLFNAWMTFKCFFLMRKSKNSCFTSDTHLITPDKDGRKCHECRTNWTSSCMQTHAEKVYDREVRLIY